LALATSARATQAGRVRFTSDPFLLGIASGYPTPDGVVLWTRLITSLLEPDSQLHSQPVMVTWEMATDSAMRRVVRRGTELATPDFAHSVHAEVTGLKPECEYWYRFTAGGVRSTTGRTRTAPAPDANLQRFRLAVACCQKFEVGYYTAYGRMLADAPDLVVHVGDYIYEETGAGNPVRGDNSPETVQLDQYRARYALYKSDEHLRAMHAAAPWLVTWDDHEVVNDYAGTFAYARPPVEEFLLRRAAAYRAYYEHMPLPRAALPAGPSMRLYAQRRFGPLLQIHMLDSRQYRSPLACLDEEGPGPGVNCAAMFDAARAMLGATQERWLAEQTASNSARWNLFAQGTPIAYSDLDRGPAAGFRRDQWDGYPAARQRLLDTVANVRNPIFLSGDIHAFQVSGVHRQASDPTQPLLASEFTATSITSSGTSQARLDDRRKDNPHVLYADSRRRGYLLMNIAPRSVRTDLVGMDTIRAPTSNATTMASFAVNDMQPGPVRI
jgi:alkaline phosphatase D